MNRTKSLLVVLAVLLGCLTVAPPGASAEWLVLYDDFNAPLIDLAKWFGSTFNDLGLEAARKLAPANPPDRTDRELSMAYRGLGSTDSDVGITLTGLRLNFKDPAPITTIQATVRVKEAEATGCPANPDATFANARLSGFFFNTGSPTPGSSVNDVLAQLRIQRVSTLPGLQVRAVVVVCLDDPCIDSLFIGAADLGSVDQGTPVTLRLQWDPANDQFIFQRDATEAVIAYTVSDASPPGANLKRLDITHFVANCTTEPRPEALMDARFDDVFVNESAAP